jgi:hypothetical protein
MQHGTLSRRAVLGLFAAGALLSVARPALADDDDESRVRTISRGERGTTLYLDLAHAPFPAPGAYYKDRTVIVYVPDYFRAPRSGEVPMLVHFHGHSTTADDAMVAHQLREQLYDSKQNAILVVPQGPVHAADSSCGKLEAPGGLSAMIDDALSTLRHRSARVALGPSGVLRGARPGRVCLSAHSGGYHAAACGVSRGGVEINEVYLFDALYADVEIFRDWVAAGRGRPPRTRHKLVSYYGEGTTAAMSTLLLGQLQRAGVDCAFERVEGTLSRAEITRAEAVFVRTALPHGAVTHELNGLRDCLYASALPRHIASTWFLHKDEARALDRRR